MLPVLSFVLLTLTFDSYIRVSECPFHEFKRCLQTGKLGHRHHPKGTLQLCIDGCSKHLLNGLIIIKFDVVY